MLLRWTEKAQESDIIPIVKKELERGNIILLPNPATDTLLLTATQEALEQQAEREHLLKKRILSSGQVVMDHFAVANRAQFCGSSLNRDSFGLFTAHERGHLVLGVLERISIYDSKLKEMLLENKHKADTSCLRYALQCHEWIDVLTPLHIDDQKVEIQRAIFWPFWQLMPPIDQIQEYYGPAIAFYFAFMGFLGRWLGALGSLGLSTFLFRLYREDTIDEDEYTPFYGLICFIWAILFFRFWEQKENMLAYKWGTLNVTKTVDDIEEDFSLERGGAGHRRPEFRGQMRTSPVTGLSELYYPSYRRKFQYFISAVVTVLMLAFAFFAMILSLNLQGYIRPRNKWHPFYYPRLAVLAEEGAIFDAQSSWRCFIPVIVHAISILTLNTIYRTVAKRLTDRENHESQRVYENSLILKRFLFEAFDCYIVLFYLAFYERDVERLRMELIAVFNIDSFRRLFMEVILPMMLHTVADKKDTEHPYDLHLDAYEEFDDYMEIMLQFGYVILFASAYPLASLVMCAAVWVEIRSDCYKLTYLCQKPAGERTSDIGMWRLLLQCMIWFSCLTNCLLFGFTSDQMMHYLPNFYIRDGEGITHMVQDKGWITVLIIFGLERVLVYLGILLHATIPSIPEDLVIQLRRRKYFLSREAKKKSE